LFDGGFEAGLRARSVRDALKRYDSQEHGVRTDANYRVRQA
jgi:hypothetical protein